jgi:putative peptide zinc metalloprotease protein
MSMRRPKLVDGVKLVEQLMQGELGYVVKSPATGAYLRFRPAEAQVIGAFTGERTVLEIAQQLAANGLVLSANAIDAFALKLAGLGLVERSLAERSSAQLERLRQERKERRRQPLFRGELLRMRFSVGDPDALLERTLPWFRWCFTPGFVYLSLVLFLVYAATITAYWGPLTDSLAALMDPRDLSIGAVVLFWAVYVCIGAIHELGHAYACKYFSGAVNEMGLMLIYFQPAFYCNVNDAWTFPRLSHRLWVTAAGGWIELWVAAGGAALWLVTTPGSFLSTLGMLTAILAGGITLLTNANPLLPFDGYFALSDYLEIPNLRQRAQQYTRWFLERHLLRRETDEPEVSDRERRIFLTFGFASLAYILLVYWFLLGVVGGWLFRTFGAPVAIGFLLLLMLWKREAVWTAWLAVRDTGRTVYRAQLHQWVQRIPRPLRGWPTALITILIVLLLPWSRSVDGTWTAVPAEHTIVTAPVAGVVGDVRVREGDAVRAGTLLMQIVNRDLEQALPRLRGTEDSLRLLAQSARARQSATMASLDADAGSARQRAENVRFARQAGVIRATIDGRVLTTDPRLLLGRQVSAGAPLLALGNPDSLELRVRLRGAGTAAVVRGQRVSLFLDADAAHPRDVPLEQVSAVASSEAGTLEGRVWLAATGAWRVGASGPARVTIARSTVGGALWWAIRSRISPDLWL